MSDEVAVHHRVPPYVLVSGPESLLAERGVAQTLDELKVTEPELETIRLYAAAYTAGELTLHASPSLFGGAKCIVVHDLDEADDELQADLLAALAGEPEPDLTLVVLHKGGSRGKKVLDTLKGSGARVIDAPAIKTDRDKADFAAHEFRAGPAQGHRRGGARARRGRGQGRPRAVGGLPAAHRRHHGRHRRAGGADLPRGQGRGDRLPGGRRGHGRRHGGGAAPAAARHRRRRRPGADRGRARPAGAPADQGRLGRAGPLRRPGPRPRHGALAGRQGPPGPRAAGPPTRSPPASPPSPRPTSRSRAAGATRSTPSSGACSPSPASTPATGPEGSGRPITARATAHRIRRC